MEDKEITLTLKTSELFQLHLCVISRSAFATQKWASACNAEEQNQAQAEIAFLNELTQRFANILNEVGAPTEKND